MIWHKLSEKKPPKPGWYWVQDERYARFGQDDEYGLGEYFAKDARRPDELGFLGGVTHWAYFAPRGELSPDDRRLLELLDNIREFLDDVYIPNDTDEGEARWLVSQIISELTARFGPDWEQLRPPSCSHENGSHDDPVTKFGFEYGGKE